MKTTERGPTTVGCEVCKAKPGEWCTVNGLRRAQGPHKTRVNEYRKVLREARGEVR